MATSLLFEAEPAALCSATFAAALPRRHGNDTREQ